MTLDEIDRVVLHSADSVDVAGNGYDTDPHRSSGRDARAEAAACR
jgi:hypothetical protein